MHGLAIYVGKDTKLMRNSGARPAWGCCAPGFRRQGFSPRAGQTAAGRAHFKRTHIDSQLNGLVLKIFMILFCMCASLAIASSQYEGSKAGQEFSEYLDRESDDPAVLGVLQFFSYLIVLSNLVPISLYVR